MRGQQPALPLKLRLRHRHEEIRRTVVTIVFRNLVFEHDMIAKGVPRQIGKDTMVLMPVLAVVREHNVRMKRFQRLEEALDRLALKRKEVTQALKELTAEQKLPKGLVQVVSGTEIKFKNFFVTHPGIKALTVVGSSETLQAVHQQVATTFGQQFKKVKFLGGSKNLSIVLSDLNENIADQVFESFLRGQGQLHWNAARLFVLEKNVKTWLDFIQTKLNSLKPAKSIEDSSLWTPIFKNAPKYQEINQQAKADQAKLLSVQTEAPIGFLKPIFTQDMSNCSELQQDQVHAPLFILSTAKYPFDIPKYANVSYYGDTANIWCEPDKGQKLIADLDVANISMNKWSVYSKNQRPGVKHSSFGMTDHRIFGAFNSNAKNLT